MSPLLLPLEQSRCFRLLLILYCALWHFTATTSSNGYGKHRDIVDVIASYLPLKRKGRNWWGKCPFHNEKTPSFSVSPDKQIYHCFGCHKGGNVFSFIMEYEKVPFPDALKLLAARANIALPDRSFKRDSKELDQLYYAHEVAAGFFAEHLRDSRKTLEYLKTRKLTDETIEKFNLGYAPDSWDAFLNHAKKKSLTEDDLEKVRSDYQERQRRLSMTASATG